MRQRDERGRLLPTPDPGPDRECRVCGAVRPINEFRPHHGNIRGRLHVCDTCRRQDLANRQAEKRKDPDWVERDKAYRKANPEKYARYTRNWLRKARLEAIAHYGGCCSCCGENAIEFLAFDHVNGGGGQHRRDEKIDSGTAMLCWIRRNNYPHTIRLLCHNCNMALGAYGYCPHQAGQTFSEWAGPQLDTIYATQQMPALLPGAARALPGRVHGEETQQHG